MKIEKFSGEHPLRRHEVQRVVGELLDRAVKQQQAQPGEKRSYVELFRRELARNSEAASTYISGPIPRVRYFLSGDGAAELLHELRDDE